jgi:hypothetical protein
MKIKAGLLFREGDEVSLRQNHSKCLYIKVHQSKTLLTIGNKKMTILNLKSFCFGELKRTI